MKPRELLEVAAIIVIGVAFVVWQVIKVADCYSTGGTPVRGLIGFACVR